MRKVAYTQLPRRTCICAKSTMPRCFQKSKLLHRRKADTIAKVITFIQILWIPILVIGHLAQHLTISIVEVAVVAYIFCATNTYILLQNKPLDIAIPYIFRATYQQRTHSVEWPQGKMEFHAFRDVCYYFLRGIGAIHLTAQAYPFLTIPEGQLWRVFCHHYDFLSIDYHDSLSTQYLIRFVPE